MKQQHQANVQNKVHPLDRYAQVYAKVKKTIVPTSEEQRQVRARAEEIRRSVEEECKKAGLTAEVRLDGSVAKDTWIRDYVDADIFMRVSPDLTKKQLQDVCLPIARRALRPHRIVERFAEHPYIESTVEFPKGSLRVNVVPCYRVERGKWLSATDRTPYHTEYVRSHLSEQQRDEVRLLKAFMRGIGSYGADIKTGGFSGMICETLIIARENFQKVLEEFARWKEGQFIDVEKYYASRGDEIHRIFIDPLVVIDPVDKGRNLGAAVRTAQLWNFTAASRSFLDKSSASFFTERKIRPITKMEFRRAIARRGSSILCIKMNRIDAVVDIVWSQLFRTQRALVNLLENNDFEVIRSSAWTDESSLSVLLFELASRELSSSKRHRGPPVSRLLESSSFLSKHLSDRNTVSGPWIEDDRWYVEKKRTVVSAHALLAPVLGSGGSNVGIAPLVIRTARKSAKILEEDKIEALLSVNREFARFLRVFLAGRPVWLV
jgi:tRNA nucleotidyltransferase (CCA-adding enzyme)